MAFPLVVKQTDANLSKLRWLSPQIAGPVADLVSPPFWNLPAPIHKEFCGKSPHPMIVWRSHVQFFSSRTRERVLEQPPDNADKAGFLPTAKSVCPFYGPTICH
jgi:hypothetical protein